MSGPVPLPDRAVLQITGPDATDFLEGLLTNSVSNFESDSLRYAGLLTPQGKLVADLFVSVCDDGFRLDIPGGQLQSLAKLLALYRLRAKTEITPRPELAVWLDDAAGYADPRSNQLQPRRIGQKPESPPSKDDQRALFAYELARIRACAPQSPHDFASNTVFPADINMDILAGIDFGKGCFIGQEVVSRMKRRATARRRSLALHIAEGAPEPGTPILHGTREIGQISSSLGEYALARVRIDRMPDGINTSMQAANHRAVCDIPPALAEAFFSS